MQVRIIPGRPYKAKVGVDLSRTSNKPPLTSAIHDFFLASLKQIDFSHIHSHFFISSAPCFIDAYSSYLLTFYLLFSVLLSSRILIFTALGIDLLPHPYVSYLPFFIMFLFHHLSLFLSLSVLRGEGPVPSRCVTINVFLS